jgi:hypothetical protein
MLEEELLAPRMMLTDVILPEVIPEGIPEEKQSKASTLIRESVKFLPAVGLVMALKIPLLSTFALV